MAVALAGVIPASTGIVDAAGPQAVASREVESKSARKRLRVPSSIDSTGSRDVSAQLNAFIGRVPNRSTIVFKRRGTYRLDGGPLWMRGERGLTLEGNGATLKLTGPGNGDGAGIFVDQQSQDITIRNLAIVGNHDAAGTPDTCCSREGQHAIAVYGSFNVLVENVDIRRVGGDCFYVGRDPKGWAKGVTFRDSTCRLTGRMGLMIEAGQDVRLLNSVFDQIGFMFVDIEPDSSISGAIGVIIRNNTVKSYGVTGNFDPFFLAACDAPWGGGSVVQNVTVSRNTVGASRSGWHRGVLGLHILVCGDTGSRRNFRVTHNRARETVDGGSSGVMRFNRVRGVTVIGNRQPLSGGKLATFSGSTHVRYRR
jgi:hypothetical protein